MTPRWYVLDWAGNVMNWGAFDSFEDAWGAIMEHCGDDEEAMGEYHVVEGKPRDSRYLEPNHPMAHVREDGMTGTWGYLAGGERLWIPEFFYSEVPAGCRAVAVRGYAHTQAVLAADGRCIGWCDA